MLLLLVLTTHCRNRTRKIEHHPFFALRQLVELSIRETSERGSAAALARRSGEGGGRWNSGGEAAPELALSMIEPLSSRIERRGVHAKIVLF